MNVLDLMIVYQLSACLLGSFAPLNYSSVDHRRWGYVVTLLVKVPILPVHLQ